MANTANLTSPDGEFSVTVTVQNPESTDGAYPIQITAAAPAGQQTAVEWNGIRIYEDTAAGGTGTEG
jgi:hypothetical protein